jgi:hypothetical protein
MFKFGVLVALISLVFVHCKSPLLDLVDDDLSSSVASAIAQFFNHVSKDRVKGFDVIVYGNETSRLEKIGNGIGKSIRIPYRYRKLDKQADEALIFLKLDRPAVFLLDSWFEYIQFLSQASAKKNQGLNFLYYVENQLYMPNALGGNSTFMERHSEMFQHFPQFYSDYFLNVNESLITLTTYDKFSPPNCNETHLIEMNEFSQTKGKWKSANFVKKKFVNLNQCEIVADMLYPQNLALQVDFNAERNATTFRGYVIKFNEIISEKMNFTFKCNPVKMVVSDNPKVFYDIAYKVTGIGAMIYEVYSFRHLTKHEWNSFFTVTKPYTKVDVIVLISRFKPYSMREKVVLPFQPAVWWWLIGSLITLAVISGLIWTFASSTVKKFVFGSRVKTPLLNMM